MRFCGMVLIVFLAAMRGPAADAAPPAPWRSDFGQALAEARRLDRPLLVHFHADWCGPCLRMDKEVLAAPELLKTLESGFVAVKIDSDEQPDLARRFEVDSLPCDVIIDAEGNVLLQTTGYQDRPTYLARLARVAARFDQGRKLRIAKTVTPQSADLSATLEADISPQPDPPPATTPPVGLNGFSPVALWTQRQWIAGRHEFSAEHKGVAYHFTSAEEVEVFNADPPRYAPQLLGCDPVILWESDRAVPGTTQFGAYFEGELFLFVSEATRQRFRQNPARFTRARHVVRINQIERPQRH